MTAVIVTVLVVILDQLTKYIVSTSMAVGESFAVIPGVFNITYVLNKGAAWGMLADNRWVFMTFSVVAIVLIAVVLVKFRKESRMMTLPLAMILGGGIGNMIDRTFYGDKLFDGAVIDFIQASFIDFPVFNIADCAVCIGAAMLFIYVAFTDGRKNRKEAPCEQNAGGSDDNCKINESANGLPADEENASDGDMNAE